MRKITGLALATLLSAGCQTDRTSDQPSGSSGPYVDDNTLAYVPEAERGAITTARTERSEMVDRVAIAERSVEQEKQRLDVAESEVDVCEADVTSAKKALAVAGNSQESNREKELDQANEKLEGARARWRSSQSKIAYHEAHIEQLRCGVGLAKMRVDLADARVELAKAKAVHEVERPEARDISVSDFEARVEEQKSLVAMAEIDADAWGKKVKLRQETLDARLEARAASYDKKN